MLSDLSLSAFSLVVAFQQLPAQLAGKVVTPTGVPIEGVEVSLRADSAVAALTDTGGRFAIPTFPAGEQVVRFRRIGYQVKYFGVNLAPSTRQDVTVVMEAGAYRLPDVVVTHRMAKPIEYAWTTRYDDFFRRRQNGIGGTFFTRAEIDKRRPLRTANILSTVPGVHLRFRHLGPSGTDVTFARCDRVSVWIDGFKQTRPYIPRPPRSNVRARPDTSAMVLSEMLERVSPSQIELMEVFRGPAEMPAEFLDDSCAAVVIWSR